MSGSDVSERETIRYWQVSPGRRKRNLWVEFKEANIIGMGWDHLGELTQYSTDQDIEKALRRHYPEDYPKEKYPSNDINSIKTFSRSISEGDVIVAKKGASREVYGIGKVLSRYHFVDARRQFKHVIDVDWIISFDDRVEVETSKEFVQWTAHSLPPSRFDEVKQSILNRFPDLNAKFNELIRGPRRSRREVSQPRNWWIEQTRVRGRPDREAGEYSLGSALWSPQRDSGGKDIYKNMRTIKESDVILHLNLSDSNIVGVSVAANEHDSSFTCLRGTPWDDGTGRRPGYLIRLKDFQPLDLPIKKEDILNEENKAKLFSTLGKHRNLFYNRNLDFNQGTYITSLPLELVTLINDIYRTKAGKDLPYFDQTMRFMDKGADVQHLVYKIAWHPGGYKGGFCGNAQSTACNAFAYVRENKQRAPCSPTVFHCVDEDEAFADAGWKVKIHSPRIAKLHELLETKSLVFLVAPLTQSKTRYRLVGFYTIKRKVLENGDVAGFSADMNRSSKFDFQEGKLEYSNSDLKNLFGLQDWTARRSYEFISNNRATSVLTRIYESHRKEGITDPDVNLGAMRLAIEDLQQGPLAPPVSNASFLHDKLELAIEELSFNPLLFEDEDNLKSQIHAALISGKHIMLVGPPGTGKTEIALSLCRIAKKKKYIHGYVLTTATSDWTTFDTIGGYVPSKEGKSLQFMPGQFLRCFKEDDKPTNKWLIIDEINRSDIDKAFGQLFTVLSGQSVDLPFFQESGCVQIIPHKSFKKPEVAKNEYVVPNSWRLIATLNTYDKASLYQMSYAFMRRFAFVYVNVPSSGFIDRNWAEYLEYWGLEYSENLRSCFDAVKDLWKSLNTGSKRPLGPAIVKDMLEFIVGYASNLSSIDESTTKRILTDAVASFVVPQFEGLERDLLDELQKRLEVYCEGERIDTLFQEMFEG